MAKSRYEEVAPRILEYLEDGLTNKEAAEKAGINESTFYSWITDYDNFSKSVQRAREVGEKKSIAKVEQSLLEHALGFEY